MKATHVVILAGLLGVLFGAGLTWANFSHSPPLDRVSVSLPVVSGPGRPKVLVDGGYHQFGAVERDTKVTHVFRISNMGDAPLVLKGRGTSCTRCTIAELSKTLVPPGESSEVTIEYTTSQYQPQFRQYATILTNDPAMPIIDLTIAGTVSTRFQIVPSSLSLANVSAKETRTAEVKVLSYLTDEVALEGYTFEKADLAPYFDVTSEPLPQDQFGDNKAKSGCLLRVALKPGLPLGPFLQTIRLELKTPGSSSATVVDLPVDGTIDSDMSIVGRGWNNDVHRLAIGSVKSSTGATRKLFIVLRGPDRHNVKITPGAITPTWLKVTVGEPSELKSGSGGGVTQIPLSIEIPPGQSPVNHLGTDQGKYAEVILETTLPDVKQFRMYVQFVVTQ